MTAFNLPRRLVMTLLVLARCSCVAAQTTPGSQAFAGVKAGMNYEQAEDALSGAVAAGGLFGGIRFGPEWAVEVELWYLRPSAIRRATRRIAIFSSASAPSVCSAREAFVHIWWPGSAWPARRTNSRHALRTGRRHHHPAYPSPPSLIVQSSTFENGGASTLTVPSSMSSAASASKCRSGGSFVSSRKFESTWHSRR